MANSISGANLDDAVASMTQRLPSGCVLRVTDRHAALTLGPSDGWTAVSSAVLHGGLMHLPAGGGHVLNAAVPADYDGMSPEPEALLTSIAADEGFDPAATIGLLTAASMKTLRTSTRTADGVVVGVIVTAGISNSRAAGADADVLCFDDEASDGTPPPGTINTIVITNAALSGAALIEAHALAIESKCAACAQLGLTCAKSGQLAQGTGTDTTVMLSARVGRHVRYSGKHTLLAELLGQAAREATQAALLACIEQLHGSLGAYRRACHARSIATALRGARPCIPPTPDAPVPAAPAAVVCVGLAAVALSYLSPLPRSAGVLLAAFAWDRCLGEPPLRVHPVVLVGNLISEAERRTPMWVFASPSLGLVGGVALLLGALGCSLVGAWLVLAAARAAAAVAVAAIAAAIAAAEVGTWLPGGAAAALDTALEGLPDAAAWLLEVLLLKSSFSLQLLCTVSAEMARLLERKRLEQAREQLAWLCSRDASHLDAEELAGGTLESLAENLSDGFVAPLVWYLAVSALLHRRLFGGECAPPPPPTRSAAPHVPHGRSRNPHSRPSADLHTDPRPPSGR